MAGYQDIIENAARARGVDPTTLLAIARLESNFDPNAYNPSGAAGLFQFMPSTAQQYGLTNPYDPTAAATAGAQLTADNTASLRRTLGRQPTTGEIYLAHQQGTSGAAKLLNNPGTPAADLIGYNAVYQNLPRSMQSQARTITAQDFANYWTGQADRAASMFPPVSIPSVGTQLDIPPMPRPRPATGIPQDASFGVRGVGQTAFPTSSSFADNGWYAPGVGAGLGGLEDPRTSSLLAYQPPPISAPTLNETMGEQAMMRRTQPALPTAPFPFPGRPPDVPAAPVPFPTPSFMLPQLPAPQVQQASGPSTLVRLPSGKMVAPGTYPSQSNPGSMVTISDDGSGNAVVKESNLGFMNPAKMGQGTVAGGYIGQQLAPAISSAIGNAKSAVVPQASAFANNISSGAQALGGQIGGMFSGLFGGSSSPPIPPLPIPAPPVYSPPTTRYTMQQMQVSNPDYLKYIAGQNADPIGAGPGSFGSLQAMMAPPAPPQFLTVSRPVAVPQAPAAAPQAPPPPPSDGGYFGGRQNAVNDTLRTLGFNV